MKKLFTLFFSIAFTTVLFAKKKPPVFTFEPRIDSLAALADTISLGTDAHRMEANKSFQRILREVLKDPISIEYPFQDKIPSLSVIQNKKGEFRIYTWVVKTDDATFDYFGFTQYQRNQKKKNSKNYVYALTNKSAEIGRDEYSTFDTSKWIGCVYYEIVEPEKRKDRTYLLFGWDGCTWRSTKKIIETITFNSKGEASFGKKVISYNEGLASKPKMVSKARLIFEFNAKVSITLSYNQEQEKIIFDHLSPSNPRLAQLYFTYAPDFSYDGLEYKNKKWVHIQDIDVRNYDLVKPVKWKPSDAANRTDKTLIPQRKK